jgi:predicted protein tyrosine phosphatase
MNAMIHVCSLAKLHETVVSTGALHVVTMLRDPDRFQRLRRISARNHLFLSMDDVTTPIDGYVSPSEEHVTQLVEFLKRWDRATPLVMHCMAGISRSTAGAFVAACALNPQRSEAAIAQAMRDASPSAMPNILLVTHADRMLGRRGRMVQAIDAIGAGLPALEGDPFRLDLE